MAAAEIDELDRQYADRLRGEAMSGDPECDHLHADVLVCELLAKLGCTRTAAAFNDVRKWYA